VCTKNQNIKKEFLEMEYGIQQGYNPLTSAAYASQLYPSQPYLSQPYASQIGQPTMFGGAPTPFGGLIGSGIGGLLGGQNFGRQPGQVIDGIGGMFQPSPNIDPMTAAHIQQAQLVQQQLQVQLAQQQLAQLLQQAQLAQQLAQQQQFGRVSPYGIDPISAAIAQQRTQFGQPLGLTPLGLNPLNRIDPITAAYVQQAQVAQLCQQLSQQNQFGNPLGHSHFGQGQLGQPQAWLGAGQNPWTNPLLASQFGRTPSQFGQVPVY
jgi:hypothetical protein